jgi:hypothetical protein
MVTVTLVLAGGPGFPSGSPDHRYEVAATLDAADHLDAAAWTADPNPWPVRCFRPGEPERRGDVQHDSETGWSLRLEASGEAPEQAEPLINPGALRPGAHVTLRSVDGRDCAWRVVNVA